MAVTKGKESRGPSNRAVTREERELLEGGATDLFEYAVKLGGIPVDDPRIAEDSTERAGFELLLKLGLVNVDTESNVYAPVDPSIVSSQVVTPLGQQGAAMLIESSEWARAFNDLGLTWRRTGTRQGPFTELHGAENINKFIRSVVDDAQTELLTAAPQTGRDFSELKEGIERTLSALERGVSMRTLYQHSARRNQTLQMYVGTVSPHGAEVRTLDEFFNRLIVVDRELAFIPGPAGGREMALAVHEPSVVAYLVDVFERSWERARLFMNKETGTVRDIAVEQREMTIRMLKEGHADPSAAKRLGVSPRTYAGYVADLKHEYDAETRFQLGYAMGQRDSSQSRSNDEG